ncbi:MAG TPA: SRPBCC family protein [Pseudoxanthomonas sp.]|uniref:SRPBCC family protein n=1 Tax=Pseudoxanthomonas sp. SE1 TaxID=1664560 RepID=UPI00240D9A60|nr:SRPBCC family protein [Pseudoxanthomonas sp. SE1]WFC42695.1 SRPBCC family protein [Pseudoxanthomonas sp. SE1]HJS33952.1 SRPBCC family protein [Pseudoxanthomonas sp.]
MRFFKWVLAAIAAVGLVLALGGLLLPATTHVERSVVIDRSPEQVFATLNSFERFSAWSPWAEYDPQARYTFEGPASGVGARMRWSGNRSVGSGSQEITTSEPHRRVVVALDFDGSQAQAAYLLEPEGDGTRLTWAFDTEHGMNPFKRWLGLVFDRMIGADYEKGLRKLKSLLEGTQA